MKQLKKKEIFSYLEFYTFVKGTPIIKISKIIEVNILYKEWQLEILSKLDLLTNNIKYLYKQEIIHSVFEYAKEINYKDLNEQELIRQYLKETPLNLSLKKIDAELSYIIDQIESTSLYPVLNYKYDTGVELHINYISLFEAEIPYFINKAKKIYWPDSLEIQGMFGLPIEDQFEQWVPQYIEWVRTTNADFFNRLFDRINGDIRQAIKRI
ncbi:hypothetical protein MZM54_02785 [[Brevibacterium] frigoritolerans]|nr:hypothetical protein [Peribacillus frigoritolerans]